MICNAHATTILVFGDSLSAGYGLESQQDWPYLLEQHFHDMGHDIKVVNHSISGETTNGGLDRLASSLKQVKPDILILELGANDGLRGLSPKNMRNNLQQMIIQARAANARVLLIGMQLPPNYGKAFNRLFARQFSQLAQDIKVAFLPFLMEPLGEGLVHYQQDGLHPNAAAQPLLRDHVLSALEPMLKP